MFRPHQNLSDEINRNIIRSEIEGGVYIGGRHVRGPGFEADCIKYAEAMLAGWRVLRVTGPMVYDGRALALVERALAPAKEHTE